ncbi:helix-turn-helix transcriptional regulator [Amycolatopsis magusensis]|uniref:Sugar-specific transcriptional regulator TrmB/DNA-binding CsgD family transcriptional regulator n=1 Tax=Amycolatopsis magusensis TaxID=882444 RepID=A0ABS4PQU5_9PSEU|nr:hypothetical protein [Amycolatopsis magusensis]MBP2181797.1 sugar-specific transcriptional regulator TrmB/DNA-binding CsgD family transcriptional regulator [Amycolatopsis magusensis]
MPLRDLGFTEEQERAYRSLLGDPYRAAAQLVPEAGSPRSRREALDRLVEFGVARADEAAPSGVSPLDPTVAVGELIERTEDDLHARLRRVGAVRAEVPELAAIYAGRRRDADEPAAGPVTGVEQLDDVRAVRERLAELSFFTRNSVYTVQPVATGDAEAAAASRPLEQRSTRRGLDVRVIYPASALALPSLRAAADEGTAIRFSDQPLERMIILDERVAVVPQDPGGTGRGALVLRQAGLLSGFLRLFHGLWREAAELPGEQADPGPDEQDREVLRLLAEGVTDENAAKTIGVSVRHLRRRVARLMQRLGADSRFEAGAEAVRRGWL